MSSEGLPDSLPSAEGPPRGGFSGVQVLGFVVLAIALTAGGTWWFVRTYVYAREFRPVELSRSERATLGSKLRTLGVDPTDVLPRPADKDEFDAEGRLVPEKYKEEPGRRDVRLSERELNAMVASNPSFARRFAIDLSDNLASAKLLIPVDPDMPVLGGKTLRLTAGLELDYRQARPVVILRGVSVMGVPIPNAWLGGLKNVDLVSEFGGNPGFWKSFADGIETIEIRDGELRVELKE
jgi:hypothetical protein